MFKKEKQQDEKSTNRIKFIVYLFAVVAILSGIVSVVSKYVHTNREEAVVKAQEFYFESTQLTLEGKEYSVSAGTDSITVDIKNYPDQLRVSEGNIEYTVEVTESGNVVYSDEGTLKGGEKSLNSVTFNVEAGKTYTVTATGTRGFEKVLSGTFIVENDGALVYKSVKDYGEYILITVRTENLTGDVRIYPIGNQLAPDNTMDILKTLKTTDETLTDTVNFTKPYSSYTYRFIKLAENTYTTTSFHVYCGDVYATPEKWVE